MQPAPLLTGGKVDVCLGPAPRPIVLAAVKRGAAQPVGQGELLGVVDPEPPLLRGIHHEQPAERPVRLATY